jgi:RHS repeat-associated protein
LDELLTRTSSAGTFYYHEDGLGNVVKLTDSTGTVQEGYSYDVFGAVTIRDGSGTVLAATASGNRFLYTGREYIAELGLYDYRNRVYSPNLGRFLQTDPIRFQAGDVNIYRYVGNRVANIIDPTGLRGFWSRAAQFTGGAALVAGGVSMGVGAAASAASSEVDGPIGIGGAYWLAARMTLLIDSGLVNIGESFGDGESVDFPSTPVEGVARLLGGKEAQQVVGATEGIQDIVHGESLIDKINGAFGAGNVFYSVFSDVTNPTYEPTPSYEDGFDPGFDPSNPFGPKPLNLKNSRCPNQ